MKTLKISAMLMAALMLLCGCTYLDYDEYDDYVAPTVQTLAAEYIGGDEELYNAIYAHLLEFDTLMEFCGNIEPKEKLRETAQRVLRENPELFWAYISYTAYFGDGSHKRLNISPLDQEMPINEVREMCDKVSDAADRIISEIPDGASDWEKILFVHDWLIENTWYQDDDTDEFTDTIYGCLVRGHTQHNGFNQAFQYIMNRLGYECGAFWNDYQLWNYIRLDGKYYWVDTACDDAFYGDDDGEKHYSHYYFMADDEHFKDQHNIEKGNNYFLPTCDSTDNYYYVVDGSYLNSVDDKAITDVLHRHKGEKEIEIQFSDDDIYEAAKKEIFGYYSAEQLGVEVPEGSVFICGYCDGIRIMFFNVGVLNEK